jgi:hypothetical protein
MVRLPLKNSLMDLHIRQTPNLSLTETPTSALTEINVGCPGLFQETPKTPPTPTVSPLMTGKQTFALTLFSKVLRLA